ncbi:hypothetical protein [Microbacterium sp. p3-SID131]|uniref:hypothetical protein n=1 Tax=Microbacterium sp. p3-SID131 TaxID=2916215 RepID=UPI0021A512DE|nr:hypothetical protein [Microbacterium sp. p3-SID131]MCT1363947.1 hypothetical protein [Microbacterium sp. p3-SID131]
MGEMLTYRQAARRVGRSMRAVRYWRARGMPMSWEIREGQKVRVVEKSVLLAWWRERMKNDPVYQINLRKRLAEHEHD